MAIPTQIQAASPETIARGAALINDGDLVAFATETVYGLGADATNAEAVARIFAAKKRPSFNPLISHVASLDAALKLGEFNSDALRAAGEFWPGPLTLVVPRKKECPVSDLATAGLDTIALRIPVKSTAIAFLEACGCPVAAPSANASGKISPTRAAHVSTSLPPPADGGPKLIIDDGPCAVGLESTVLDVSGQIPTILRIGGISVEQVETVFPEIQLAGIDDDAPRSPGMLSRHYAPSVPIRLNVSEPAPNEIHLGFGNCAQTASYNLSTSGDVDEAAAKFFTLLHRADSEKPSAIAVAPIPNTGLGRAINDRLKRAARDYGEA